MSRIIAEIYVDEYRAGTDIDGGTLDYIEEKIGSLHSDGLDLGDAILVDYDSDSRWERYINYLSSWVLSHNDEACDGMSPKCYDEWCDNEDNDEDWED